MSDDVVNGLLGRQLGPCELLDVVGSGMCGTVFRARESTRADVWRAVKVMIGPVADVTAFKFRLPPEVHTAMTLSHPHVLPVYRFGSEEGLQYLVMELVDCVSLRDHLRQAPVEGRHADPAMHQNLRQVAAALDYAHARRVVHCGVSPANILLRRPDRHALVSDFCIARAIPLDRVAELGIPLDCAYRSPEQCGPAQGEVTPASDVYSLAAVLWHVAAGAPPFGSGLEARARHVSEPVPDLPHTLPAGLQDVLARGLAKAPGDRQKRPSQLVNEFIAAVESRRTAPVAVPVPVAPPPVPVAPPPVPWTPPPPVPVVPPVPVAPEPVAAAVAPAANPQPVRRQFAAPAPAFDPNRELRESPLWRPFPTAEPPPKPRRTWRPPLWLLAAVAGVLVVGTLGVVGARLLGSAPPQTVARSTPTAQPVVVVTPKRVLALPGPVSGSVGRPVTVSGMRVTVVSGPTAPQGATPVPAPRAGEHFVAVEVLYENTGKPPAIVSPYDWVLTDAQGRTYGATPSGLPNDLPQRQLPTGGEARGLIGFAVPESANGLVLHFAAEPGDAIATFALG